METPCPAPSIQTPSTMCECQYPKDKPIDLEKPLYGTKAISWKHALVYSDTLASHWKSKVELMPDELISRLAATKRSSTDPMHPVLISNVQLERESEGTVLVFPDAKVYDVSSSNASEFMKQVLNPNGDPSQIPSQPFQGKLVLICGHEQRDIRCGLIAPILHNEFRENLKQRGLLYNPIDNAHGVRVGLVSHIGGHAYAGNVLYFDEDGLTIWYGRCEARHVDGIIQETIINKNIIKEMFRGRFT